MYYREDQEPLQAHLRCLSRLEVGWRLHDRQAVAAAVCRYCVGHVTPGLLISGLLIN
jgi:hypothetical protein